jgi:pimeloyl-ACP methyl ester carboxylesterase
VIWGADDKLDPVSTGEELLKRLTCEKEMVVVEGNGHVGHLDRNRHEVSRLTSDWLVKHLGLP